MPDVETNPYRGVYILFGGLLLILSSILEFVIGNTFPSVVFGHLGMFCQSMTDDKVEVVILISTGAFCLAFGATMLPTFNAAGKSSNYPFLRSKMHE